MSGLPPIGYFFAEARVASDWLRGRAAAPAIAARFPGDGRRVIVIPGLFASDAETSLLRQTITRAGYRTSGWGLGRNMPISADILQRFDAHVRTVQGGDAAPVALVGWSLGGIIAREYAKFAPGRVERVLTLGSPFSGDIRENRAWRAYELFAPYKIDRIPISIDRAAKPPVRTIAIWSARDGIVPVHAARGQPGERDEEIEISCGHMAMTVAPDALEAVLKGLRGS